MTDSWLVRCPYCGRLSAITYVPDRRTGEVSLLHHCFEGCGTRHIGPRELAMKWASREASTSGGTAWEPLEEDPSTGEWVGADSGERWEVVQ